MRRRGQALADSEIRIPMFTLSAEAADSLLACAGRKLAELQATMEADSKPVRMPLEALARQAAIPPSAKAGTA